jgi:hypothetical protein
VAEGKEYRYIGTYATTLASGQPVEPGEFVYLDDSAVKDNEAMIEEETLIATEQPSETGETKGTTKSRSKKES